MRLSHNTDVNYDIYNDNVVTFNSPLIHFEFH